MTFLTSRRTLLTQSAALLGFAFLPHAHAAASWSAEAFERARPIERAVIDHPFLKALADGTIEKDKILWYLAQNAGYLNNYAASTTIAQCTCSPCSARWMPQPPISMERFSRMRCARSRICSAATPVMPSAHSGVFATPSVCPRR